MADFRINVIVDPTSAQRGSRSVQRSLNQVSNTANRLRNTLARSFAVLGTGVGIVGGIRLLADFEQQLSTVRAITGATETEFQQLRDTAQELGATTRFSASQAADALTFLARAGFDAGQSIETVDDTLRLAQAGALDLGRAADIATNVLTGFRLSTDEAGRVVDVLALAANTANTDVNQLGEALKFVAPVAAGLNVSLEQTTAAIQVLSNAGLQASVAGTGLRRVLSELESPSTKTARLLADLGVSADQVRVSQVGLAEALQVLADAGVDTGLALELFGDRGGPAFEVLRNAIPDLAEFTDGLNNAGGTAERIATIMDDNLNGALLQVRSAFEGLILSFGEAGATNALTILFQALAQTLRFLAENTEIVSLGITILAATLVQRLIPSLVASVTSVRALTGALAINPFTALIAGAGAAFFAVERLRREFDEVTETFRESEGSLGTLTDFGRVGANIARLRGNIERLQAVLERDPTNQAAVRELEAQTQQLQGFLDTQEMLIASTKEAREERQRQQEAVEAVNMSLQMALSSLQEEARLLRLGNRERETQAELLQTVQRLERDGVDISPEQRAALETQIEANRALREQADLLDELQGPQEQFQARLQAAQMLLRDGRITTDEFTRAIRTLVQEFPELELPDLPDFPDLPELSRLDLDIPGLRNGNRALRTRSEILQQVANDLGQEERLIRLSSSARMVETNLLRLESQLRREGVELTDQERESLRARLTGLQELEAQQRLLQESLEETAEAAMRSGTTIGDGLSAGFVQVQDTLNDLGSVTEGALVGTFQDLENAVVSFATTGSANFSELVDNILADISRLLARQGLQALLGLFTGGLGGGATGLFGDLLGSIFGRQGGGPTPTNQPFFVGESGPEVFVPPTAGQVVSNEQIMRAVGSAMGIGGSGTTTPVVVPAPEVAVRIINQTNPSDSVDAIDSPEGEQVILNIISRRKDTFRNLLR